MTTDNDDQRLADKAQGRIISFQIRAVLTPPQIDPCGENTDAAVEIGIGLMREAMWVLRHAAEREGFEVEIEFKQLVY